MTESQSGMHDHKDITFDLSGAVRRLLEGKVGPRHDACYCLDGDAARLRNHVTVPTKT